MKPTVKNISSLLILFLMIGCSVVEVVDHWVNLKNQQWDKVTKVQIPVNISDTGYYYNLSMNVRVTNDYKYSNMWVKLNILSPDSSSSSENYLLTLADDRGKWIGNNLGHIISFRIPVIKDKVFNKSGNYTFELEQYMRDTVLKEVVSIGIKLDKQQEILK